MAFGGGGQRAAPGQFCRRATSRTDCAIAWPSRTAAALISLRPAKALVTRSRATCRESSEKFASRCGAVPQHVR
jgi:hypothetical protein